MQASDVLSGVFVLIFVGHLLHYQAAERPDQKTRRRVVVAGDDSLLPHSWESGQEGVKILKDVVSKAYVKAHNMVVVYAVIGEGTISFPLFLQLHNCDMPRHCLQQLFQDNCQDSPDTQPVPRIGKSTSLIRWRA